jgi:hypothetical protein
MLGEISFKAKGDGSAVDTFPEGLEAAMGSSKTDIESALTHSTVVVNGELTASDLTPAW